MLSSLGVAGSSQNVSAMKELLQLANTNGNCCLKAGYLTSIETKILFS